jgi:hypothetical protein
MQMDDDYSLVPPCRHFSADIFLIHLGSREGQRIPVSLPSYFSLQSQPPFRDELNDEGVYANICEQFTYTTQPHTVTSANVLSIPRIRQSPTQCHILKYTLE